MIKIILLRNLFSWSYLSSKIKKISAALYRTMEKKISWLTILSSNFCPKFLFEGNERHLKFKNIILRCKNFSIVSHNWEKTRPL